MKRAISPGRAHWTRRRDRRRGVRGRWTRLAWFDFVTGAPSISAGVAFTALEVQYFGVHCALGDSTAGASCSLLTFIEWET